MQFTGHSLPVHQSMSVSWALPCPISSAKSTHTISFDYWPLECVTSFRRITLLWHVCSGRRSKYNSKTDINGCPWYDTKQFNGEILVILELWGMWSTLKLPLFPSELMPGLLVADRVLSICQMELFHIQTGCKQMTYAKLNCNKTVWSFNCVQTTNLCLIELLLIHMIFATIKLCSNEGVMLNWIISIK